MAMVYTLKEAQSRYFELFCPRTKLPLNGRKPENDSLINRKTPEIVINHRETRMAKDGEYKHRLQRTNLKN